MNGLMRTLLPAGPITSLLRSVINRFPRHCLFCLERTEHNSNICHHCLSALSLNSSCCQRCALPMDNVITEDIVLCGNCLSHHYHYDQVYSPFLYTRELRYLIKKLKYQKKIHFADVLVELFISQTSVLQDFQLPQALIPMPMHARRLRQRGYNQALELGRKLARHYQLPLQFSQLVRQRYTALQAGLKATERQKNVRQAFAVRKPINYEHIALVDDVMTTGSTVNEAARLLKQHGVKQVDVWTMVRAGLKH